jgi:hypothetical protein
MIKVSPVFILLLFRRWYSTPIFATFLAVVVSIDQQQIAFEYFNKKAFLFTSTTFALQYIVGQ